MKYTKSWTNTATIKEGVDEEMKKRQAKIREEAVRWADEKGAKTEKYELGRGGERAVHEEVEERENILVETYCR